MHLVPIDGHHLYLASQSLLQKRSRIQGSATPSTVGEGSKLFLAPQQQSFTFRADLPVRSSKAVAKTENTLFARRATEPKPVATPEPAATMANAPEISGVQNSTGLSNVGEGFKLVVPA